MISTSEPVFLTSDIGSTQHKFRFARLFLARRAADPLMEELLLAEGEQEDLLSRIAKRTAALAAIHETAAYRAWASWWSSASVEELWRPGMVFVPPPPQPADAVSKRTWEKALQAYRIALKDWKDWSETEGAAAAAAAAAAATPQPQQPQQPDKGKGIDGGKGKGKVEGKGIEGKGKGIDDGKGKSENWLQLGIDDCKGKGIDDGKGKSGKGLGKGKSKAAAVRAHNTAVAARAAWSDWAHRLVNRLVWCPMCEQTGHTLSQCPEVVALDELHPDSRYCCQYCDSVAHHHRDCEHALVKVMDRRDKGMDSRDKALRELTHQELQQQHPKLKQLLKQHHKRLAAAAAPTAAAAAANSSSSRSWQHAQQPGSSSSSFLSPEGGL